MWHAGYPPIMSIMSRNLRSTEQGVGMGTLVAFQNFSASFAPLMFGSMYSHFSQRNWPSEPFTAR